MIVTATLLSCAAPALARADTTQTVNGVVVQPGGVVVDGDAIVYQGGAVVVDTSASTPDPGLAAFDIDPDGPIHGCLKGYMCLYDLASYGGAHQFLNICCTWIDLSDYGFDDTAGSYINRTGDQVKLAKQDDGGGAILCVPAGDEQDSMPTGWGNKVSSIRILANGGCS